MGSEETIILMRKFGMKAEYEGRKVTLNKPTKGDRKKYKVYVKNDKGNVVKIEFGDPDMEIKRDDPKRRKNFRSRHRCDKDPPKKWEPRYWSCEFWEEDKTVSELMGKKAERVALRYILKCR